MLTVRQVAELGGVSGQRVRRLLSLGRFPGAFMFGVSWAIPESAARAWVDDERRRRFGVGVKRAEVVRLCDSCKRPVTHRDELAGRCPGCGAVLLTLA